VDVRGAYEGIDVENGEYLFFDEDGKPLTPVFNTPNQRGRWWVWSSQDFELRPSAADAPDLLNSMQPGISLDPNTFFSTIDEVRTYLRERQLG
jgi:hypothetical protein